jgi:hypothetical protein
MPAVEGSPCIFFSDYFSFSCIIFVNCISSLCVFRLLQQCSWPFCRTWVQCHVTGLLIPDVLSWNIGLIFQGSDVEAFWPLRWDHYNVLKHWELFTQWPCSISQNNGNHCNNVQQKSSKEVMRNWSYLLSV